MNNNIPDRGRRVIVLGTGGTISGRAGSAGDNIGYKAGEIGVAQLLEGVDAPPGIALFAEQISQIDSKDMAFDIWRRLALRCAYWLAEPDVAGVVVTHGTDTLEETAFFLQSVLSPNRPVVLASAMRPASALAPDGPQNLRDAIAVAATPGARGVLAVCAGRVHGALDVRKVHTYRLDAFDSGDAGPIGHVEEGLLRQVREWPEVEPGAAFLFDRVAAATHWPWVEIVSSHAEARSTIVDMLLAQRRAVQARAAEVGTVADDAIAGLVLAATGNGTLHQELESAALRAQAEGVAVIRATRCAEGPILPREQELLRDAGGLSPVKARIALMLELLA